MRPLIRFSAGSLALASALAMVVSAPAAAADFWKHWGDGRAELNGYRLTQPRYGALRSGSAVLIFVTEDFSDEWRVKTESRAGAPSGVYPVLKLNLLRQFQTGIYDSGRFRAIVFRMDVQGGAKTEWFVEEAWPHRLLRWSSDQGEEAVLLGSSRQPYWTQNGAGGEQFLSELGLRTPTRLP